MAVVGLAKITKEESIRQIRAEFENTMAEVTAAVNDAQDGYLIDGSEQRCRAAFGEPRNEETRNGRRPEIVESGGSGCGGPGVVFRIRPESTPDPFAPPWNLKEWWWLMLPQAQDLGRAK